MSESDLIVDSWYLGKYRDVALAGVPADTHYETWGWHEGRDPDALFDTSWYLAHNPDVAAAHVDPLWHYDTFGWHEGRDPSAAFDSSDYLARNPDVAAAGVDPLTHYLLHGQAEGRHIDPSGTALGGPSPPPTQHTIMGTMGSDTLEGTSGADAMYGRGGHDILHALDGNDLLYGGGSFDWLYGGNGADRLYGGSGDDALFGGDGTNVLYGGGGNDNFGFVLNETFNLDNTISAEQFGHNVIADWNNGDRIYIGTHQHIPTGGDEDFYETVNFYSVDTNQNGRTDAGDTDVSEVNGSTIIDLGQLASPWARGSETPEGTVTIAHVLGLTQAVFMAGE